MNKRQRFPFYFDPLLESITFYDFSCNTIGFFCSQQINSHFFFFFKLQMDKIVNVLEKERDLSHYAVHIDMDAFFAAVEMRDNPSLRHVPMAVGSDSMLVSKSFTLLF